MKDEIVITGAKLHNLKNVSLSIPKNKLVVLTGLSGSGKSTLAFDTLHKEGQRQYMESLGMVTDYLSKPPVDSISGLSPSISVDQHLTNHSPRSTVGTATEIFTYLRVLFARLGSRPCPACGKIVPPNYQAGNIGWEDELENDAETGNAFPCPHCGKPVPELSMTHFSFNKPAGACPTCTGLGEILTADLAVLIDPDKTIAAGGVIKWDIYEIARYTQTLQAAARYFNFEIDLSRPIKTWSPLQRDLLVYGVHHPRFRQYFPAIEPPETAANGRFEGLETNLLRRYGERANDAAYREKLEKLLRKQPCPDCRGARLRPESRAVTVNGQNIIQVEQLSLEVLAGWIERLPETLAAEGQEIAAPIVADLQERIRRLVDVGVGYLTLERASPTLSGGEAQRLRLAALLGSGLTGVLYVLDEPSIGLHPRDTRRLLKIMRRLADLGNTVLVIEHDAEIFRAADYLIDIGPGAGRNGGRVVAAGTPDQVAANPASLTGGYLSGRLSVPAPEHRRRGNGRWLTIYGAREHNLQNITVSLPLGTLIAVAGVSGSGKSSLMFDILDRAARQRFNGGGDLPGAHDRITGWEHLDKVITIDQTAIGRSPRSNAATYTDAFTAIREAFAATPEARKRGLKASHFSFNIPGGRCERCQGAGVLTIEMHFLPDVEVRCPACQGRRFKPDVLAVTYNGFNVTQIFDMTIEEAVGVFAGVPAAEARLALMAEVGLGYLKLGQPATTLSGGEAQRVKLAKELGRRGAGRTLYLLDEPTTGLHPADVTNLLALLHRLVDAGNSVAVVEHNLDVIKAADWVIELGPEGGKFGGQLIAQGAPEKVAAENSPTGQFLRPFFPEQMPVNA